MRLAVDVTPVWWLYVRGMANDHTVLFSADVISGAVRDLAASIDRDLGGSRLVVITVLEGAVMFACDRVRAMETETEMAFLRRRRIPTGSRLVRHSNSSSTSNLVSPAGMC